MIGLQEAYRCREVLADLGREHGYDVVQGENVGEGADCAVLVRTDAPVVRRGLARMRERWIGPKHHLPKQPRVFPRARARLFDDVELRVMSAHPATGGPHGPNGASVRESLTRIAHWIQKGHR